MGSLWRCSARPAHWYPTRRSGIKPGEHGGADGIVHVPRSILAEADLIMAVDGYPTLADLTRETLRRTCTCPHA